jgi:hypothetical protein
MRLLLALFTLTAVACDDTPKRVSDTVASLTPLPRVPSKLTALLADLKTTIDAAGDSSAKHIILARTALVDAYIDGLLIAELSGQGTRPFEALLQSDPHELLAGAADLLKVTPKDHPLHAFVGVLAKTPGVDRATALSALANGEGRAAALARLVLAMRFKALLDAPSPEPNRIVDFYPYACPKSLAALGRGEHPSAKDSGCAVRCEAFVEDPKSDPKTNRRALRKACPAKALGLRNSDELRYAGPLLAPLRFALLHGEANLRRARKDTGPVAQRVRRHLGNIQTQLSDSAFPAPYPGWFGPGEFQTGVLMAFAQPVVGGRRPAAQRFASVSRHGQIRIGIRPALSATEQGLRFLDFESELAWPGRLVRTSKDPLFPAPSGDPLKDSLAGLNMRAEVLFDEASKKPFMVVLARKAPALSVGRVLAELPRGTVIELGYWRNGVKAVRAQVGWTRTQKTIELTGRDTPTQQDAGRPNLVIHLRDAGAAAPPAAPANAAAQNQDTGAKKLDTGQPPAALAQVLGEAEEPRTSDAGTLAMGAVGTVKLNRAIKRARVSISGKELLFNDLAGDARLTLRGYRSDRRGAAMTSWRKRLRTLCATLPEKTGVMLFVRRDAPMDAIIELVGALAPRAVNVSFPHRVVERVEDDLYAAPR